MSKSALGSTVAVSYRQGLFDGVLVVPVEGAVLDTRNTVKYNFYKSYASPKAILLHVIVEVPENTDLLEARKVVHVDTWS